MGLNDDGECAGSQLCLVRRLCQGMHVGVCPQCLDGRPIRFCAELRFSDGSLVVTALDGLHHLKPTASLQSLAVYKHVPHQGYSRLLLKNSEISDFKMAYRVSKDVADENDSELIVGGSETDTSRNHNFKNRKVNTF